MILRDRQKELVEKSVAALMKHGNTLSVAPTGAGKTICLSAVIGELAKDSLDFKACVLAHRDELTYQNLDKFSLVNPHITTSLYNANIKSWDGQVTFAMVQTLARDNNLQTMPLVDLLVIDEAHHVTASSYQDILNRAKQVNPAVKIFGVTATPMRGDKSCLGKVFSNCGDQIKLGELIASGHLVRPRTFIVDLGNTQERLQALRVKSTGDYSEQEVADILDTMPLNSEVVRHWKEKAGDRKTVVFCPTIEHAENITNAFNASGIPTVLLTGDTTAEQRAHVLNSITTGQAQVIVNVAVLTEGWDFPPISCVVLLRSSSYKSTMIQMIGRGLRTIDHELYPDIVKLDCVVLDFGISSVLHGSLEQSIDLKSREEGNKICPRCKKRIPKVATECPLCGLDLTVVFEPEGTEPKKAKRVIADFTMSEIDLLERSNFSWTDLKMGNGAMLAAGFNSWCCVFRQDDIWIAIGGDAKKTSEEDYHIPTKVIYKGGKLECIAAANDFLCRFEDESTAKKTASWRDYPPSENQLKWLPEKYKNDCSLTKGDASNYLAYRFNAKPQLKELGFSL
jgi:superfamily II DNA or RNA helicase